MRRPFFVLLLALASCKSADKDPEEAPKEKVPSTPEKRGAVLGAPKKTDAWFDREIEAAANEHEEGRHREALERIYNARDQNPAEAHARQLDRLIEIIHKAVLELDTLEASLEFDKDPIAFGEPLRLRVRLHNLGDRPIRIPAGGKDTSRSQFLLTVIRRDYDVRAQVATRQTLVRKPLQSDLDVPAGGTAEQVVVLEAAEIGNDKGLDGFRSFTISGRLRPVHLEVGGLRRWEAVRIRPAMARSFRPNWEPLAKDPLEKLELALKRQLGVHLLTAAALLDMQDRRAAVDLMVTDLRGDRRIDWAMFAALQHLTNLNMGRDAAAWRAWWPRVRATFFEVPEKRRDDKPVFD